MCCHPVYCGRQRTPIGACELISRRRAGRRPTAVLFTPEFFFRQVLRLSFAVLAFSSFFARWISSSLSHIGREVHFRLPATRPLSTGGHGARKIRDRSTSPSFEPTTEPSEISRIQTEAPRRPIKSGQKIAISYATRTCTSRSALHGSSPC